MHASDTSDIPPAVSVVIVARLQGWPPRGPPAAPAPARTGAASGGRPDQGSPEGSSSSEDSPPRPQGAWPGAGTQQPGQMVRAVGGSRAETGLQC